MISVKFLPFSREFEDLTWNTEFYRERGKTCQCAVAAPSTGKRDLVGCIWEQWDQMGSPGAVQMLL